MRITKIIGRNIKGKTFALEVQPICIVTGDNGVGKTAVADAVRVAMLGYEPSLGERDTFLLSSGMTLATGLAYDDGTSILRQWTQTDGSVKYSGPQEPTAPPVLFNARDYLKRTAKERVAMMFERIAERATFDASELTAALKMIKLEEHDAEAERVVGDLVDEVEVMDQERLELKQPLPNWLAKVIARFKERESDATATVKTMRASLKAQAQLAANSGLVTVRPNLEVLLAQARAERERLLALVTKAKVDKETAEAQAGMIAKAKAAVEECPPCVEELASAEKAVTEWKAVVEGKGEQWPALTGQLAQAKTKLASAEHAVVTATNEWKRLKAELDLATQGDCCPECGSKTVKWKTKRQGKYQPLVDEALTKRLEFAEQVVTAKAEVERLTLLEEAAKTGDAALQLAHTNLHKAQMEVQRLTSQARTRKTNVDFLASVQVTPTGAPFDMEGTIALGKTAAATIATLEAEQKKAMQARADNARREQALAEVAEQDRIAKVAKAATKLLLEAQERIIEDSVGEFMAECSTLLERVMGKRLEFREGAIGFWRGTQWVGHKTFSGAEEYAAFAGLALALADRAPCRVVILDELGKLTKPRKLALLEVVREMIAAGRIDNFLGIDPEERDYQGLTLQLLQVTGEPVTNGSKTTALIPAALRA